MALNGLKRQKAFGCLAFQNVHQRALSCTPRRCLPVLLSSQFIPTLRSDALSEEQLDSVKRLLQGGYIRQSSSGFYTFLPMGLRMIRKIEAIVDEEMEKIGASKMELPTLLSSSLWHKSGRFESIGSELYKVKDRKGSEYIMAPTFEEEITKLVGDEVHSWRNLPIKVYQTSRKYRDEPRPRNGLLRTKEFLMKDLYTFDANLQDAQESYKQVRAAYDVIMTRLFGQQGKGWVTAQADTGAMGGVQSHEYQVPDGAGEDELFKCSVCSYTANGELAVSLLPSLAQMPISSEDLQITLYGSDDVQAQGCTMTAIVTPKERKSNITKLAKYISKDSGAIVADHPIWDWKELPEGPMIRFDNLRVLVDSFCTHVEADEISLAILQAIEAYGSPPGSQISTSLRSNNAPMLQDFFQQTNAISMDIVDLNEAQVGDMCSLCKKGTLESMKSIEVGHAFLLGTKYSTSLGYQFSNRNGTSKEPFQMGCYGIGITRIMGVLAQLALQRFESLKSVTTRAKDGFVWNRNVAPFTALILPIKWNEKTKQASDILCNALQHSNTLAGWDPIKDKDIALDDRITLSMGMRLADADLLGSPLLFVLGDHFEKTDEVEIRQRIESGVETTFVPLSHFTK